MINIMGHRNRKATEFSTSRSKLSDFSNVYIIVTGTITGTAGVSLILKKRVAFNIVLLISIKHD